MDLVVTRDGEPATKYNRAVNAVHVGVAAVVLAWIGACGGKAVVDAGASGGGASSGSGTSVAGPGVVTGSGPGTTAASAGPGGGPTLCADACGAIAPCLAAPKACVDDCNEDLGGGCATPFAGWLSCLANADGTCAMPPGCLGALQGWLQCEGHCSSSGGCWVGSDGSCGCAQYCDGTGMLETSCKQDGMGGVACECFADMQYQGSCYDSVGSGACGEVLTGCCAIVFFSGGV